MWNPNKSHKQFDEEEDTDESWEVKAFEQDTKANLSGGATWPPRSYSCNFCRREFRSAQALGGHMNVHRRDRATAAALTNNGNAAAAAAARGGGGRGRGKSFINSCLPTTLIIQSTSTSNSSNIIDQGLSHQFYQFQNPSGIFGNSSDLMNLYATSFPPPPPPPLSDGETIETSIGDELDLELRLGHKTTIAQPPYNN